jgi:hypothetical protein
MSHLRRFQLLRGSVAVLPQQASHERGYCLPYFEWQVRPTRPFVDEFEQPDLVVRN